ncbi:hypothetical protein HNY73_023153 [Argiope bruennichi]|uniref:Uncharacterized protein n=1 Tax=Argiope bruennichi TaxID=94029 RepID=A0A8T0E400_ARGBR|nr:hypothetical protein HNY73_023153 [Argiope bruennichi]
MKKLFRSIFTLPSIPKLHFISGAESEKDADNKSTFLNKSQTNDAIQVIQQYHPSVRRKFNEDLGLDAEIPRPMKEFSVINCYQTGNLKNIRHHKLSPIPEETEEELARWNESTEFDTNLTWTTKQKEKYNENKMHQIRNCLLSKEQQASFTKNAPEMIKMLQEMTLFTISKESKQKKNVTK